MHRVDLTTTVFGVAHRYCNNMRMVIRTERDASLKVTGLERKKNNLLTGGGPIKARDAMTKDVQQ
jgi:hypothetical protein